MKIEYLESELYENINELSSLNSIYAELKASDEFMRYYQVIPQLKVIKINLNELKRLAREQFEESEREYVRIGALRTGAKFIMDVTEHIYGQILTLEKVVENIDMEFENTI